MNYIFARFRPFATIRPLILGALTLAVASTAAMAAPIDNPVLRSFYWFRFVAGKDVREGCTAGGHDHIRLVYNAIYREQVRAYDIQTRPDGTAKLTVRVLGPAVLNSVEFTEPSGVLNPWRGRRAERQLSAAEVSTLVRSIEESGGLEFPRHRLDLPSNDFYWAVSACYRGKFTSTAYHYPTDGFRRVKFANLLFEMDTTGVPVNPVRELTPSSLRGDQTQVWHLNVTKDGIQY